MPEPLRSLVPINMMDTLELGFVSLGDALWIVRPGSTGPHKKRTGSGSCHGSCRTGTR